MRLDMAVSAVFALYGRQVKTRTVRCEVMYCQVKVIVLVQSDLCAVGCRFNKDAWLRCRCGEAENDVDIENAGMLLTCTSEDNS